MLITLSTTHEPATDLGWLLHKNPDSDYQRDFPWGQVHVVWPEASESRAMCAMILEVDPIQLVRGRANTHVDGPLQQYVNDRPYAANSLLSVAIAKTFGSALSGRCNKRPELVTTELPLEVRLPVLPCRGGRALLDKLFLPLGYAIEATQLPLDEQHPSWGMSNLFDVTLRKTTRLQAMLQHLYILVPVLDDKKHYWVGEDEVQKLVDKGEGWLQDHPEREQIALRYLKRRRSLARKAIHALLPESDPAPPTERHRERTLEKPLSLQKRRIQRVVELLGELGARRVGDLGCGEGQLVNALLTDTRFDRIVAADVSLNELERAERKLKLEDRPAAVRDRLTLIQGVLGWQDARFDDLDAACLIEVIEHIDLDRLPAVVEALFGLNRPRHVIISTPNAEYNVLFESLAAGTHRHHDHRFEWDRPTFESWCREVADTHGYTVRFEGIGEVHETHGAPTQVGVFSR